MKQPHSLFKFITSCFVVLPVFLSTAFAHSDAAAHTDTKIEILKGQAIELDLRALCTSELVDCDNQTLTVSRQPTEGVIFAKKGSDTIRYQHAGTSTVKDKFVIKASTEDQSESILVTIAISTKTPTLQITSPKPGAQVKSGDVEILFSVEGPGVDHVHVALEEGQHVSVSPDAGRYTFEDVEPGIYHLTAALASSSHRDIARSKVSLKFRVTD